MMEMEYLRAFPKVELHLHLDCSLSFDVVQLLAPQTTRKQYEKNFIAPPKCKDLADFLKCTISGIALMQTETQLRAVVQDLFEQLAAENVIYAELRFAPLQHVMQDLSVEQVVEIVGESVQQNSAATGITAGLILCTLRHYSEQQSLQTVHLVQKYRKSLPVVGFDIAADEAGFPIDAHIAAFAYAEKYGIPTTAHAGEAKGPESVWETLQYFHPKRIGHGVRSIENKSLLLQLASKQIHLEVCPTCNIQTDIYETLAQHPINDLYNAGISLSVNTDARSLVHVSLTDEYAHLAHTFNWDAEHFTKINLNAINAAFVDDETRTALAQKLLQQIAALSSV